MSKATIREFVVETLREIRSVPEIPVETLLTVAEMVGANEPLNLNRDVRFIAPFIKRYEKLYRMWSDFAPDTPVEQIISFSSSKTYFSCTKDLQAIIQMMENSNLSTDDVAITTFAGEGFDPYEFIRVGMAQHPFHEETEFLRSVLHENEYQKEIIVIRILGTQKKISVP